MPIYALLKDQKYRKAGFRLEKVFTK